VVGRLRWPDTEAALRNHVADWSPRFIDADVAEGLQDEVAVLLGG